MYLETDRLIIKNFYEQDWEMLQNIIVDKESSPFAYMDHAWPTGNQQMKEICNWFCKNDEFFAVWTKQENCIIGFVCLNNTDGPKVKNLGYCLHSRHQGNGYAFEACTKLINQAFENGSTETITTGTGIANKPSVRLLEKLGFVLKSTEATHFQTDADGNPMVFEGGSFELTKDRWRVHAGF
jgi:RimJ/RimL family protein N-acetyltransferase